MFEDPIQAKNTRRSLSPTISGKSQGGGVGVQSRWSPTPQPDSCAVTRAPRSQATRSCGGRGFPEGLGAGLSRRERLQAWGDPALGLQRRPRRSRRRFSDSAGPAEASGGRVCGTSGLVHRISALRVPHSPEGLQPEPGPAHRARPQPAPQPRVRAAWPVLVLGFVVLSCPGTNPETRATRACGPHGKSGFIRSGEFCPLLWSNSETPLISASRRTPYCQGPACTAVYGVSNKPNLFKRSLRSTQAKAGSSEFRPPLPPLRYRGYHVLSP